MPDRDHPAKTRDDGVDAEITLRGLFMMLTGSIRQLFSARHSQDERRQITGLRPQINPRSRNGRKRRDDVTT